MRSPERNNASAEVQVIHHQVERFMNQSATAKKK
jgi:hypothetical protein